MGEAGAGRDGVSGFLLRKKATNPVPTGSPVTLLLSR